MAANSKSGSLFTVAKTATFDSLNSDASYTIDLNNTGDSLISTTPESQSRSEPEQTCRAKRNLGGDDLLSFFDDDENDDDDDDDLGAKAESLADSPDDNSSSRRLINTEDSISPPTGKLDLPVIKLMSTVIDSEATSSKSTSKSTSKIIANGKKFAGQANNTNNKNKKDLVVGENTTNLSSIGTNEMQISSTSKQMICYGKDPAIILATARMTKAANHIPNTNGTKPLVINKNNHSSSVSNNHSDQKTRKTTDISDIDNQGDVTLIPSLSSHIIFSSVITSHNTTAKLPPTITKFSSSQPQIISQSRKADSKTKPEILIVENLLGESSSKNDDSERSTMTKTSYSTYTSKNDHRPDVRLSSSSSSPTNITTTTTPTASPSSKGANLNGSNASPVAARLMDIGKKLLDAARQGQVDHVRQLVVNSGAPFTSDWLGTTALHLAAQNGHAEIAEILLRNGVNRDARTKLERTALHLAAQAGFPDVVDVLLNHGSDVNARDMLKMTPLHWAVERGHVWVAERLMFSGADVGLPSKFQLSPVDIAKNSNSNQMMELFKRWIDKIDHHNKLTVFNVPNDSDANITDLINPSEVLDVNYHLALEDNETTSRASMLDIDEPCIDLVELEWNSLKFEPDFFLTNEEDDEPKVEYLMKIVEELQKENRQLRQRVEQLSTSDQ